MPLYVNKREGKIAILAILAWGAVCYLVSQDRHLALWKAFEDEGCKQHPELCRQQEAFDPVAAQQRVDRKAKQPCSTAKREGNGFCTDRTGETCPVVWLDEEGLCDTPEANKNRARKSAKLERGEGDD